MSEVSRLRRAIPNRRRTRNYDITDVTSLVEYLEEYLTPVGTIINKLTSTSPGEAWVQVSGQSLSKDDYPELYAELGGMFGETDDEFTLPDLSDTYLTGSSSTDAGQFLGSNSFQITIDQLPAHGHSITDEGHTHDFTSEPHGHGVTDAGHSHTSGGHGDTASAAAGTDVITVVDAANTSSDTSGVSVEQSTVTGTNSSSMTGISVEETGGGQAVDNRPKSISVFYFIKARA